MGTRASHFGDDGDYPRMRMAVQCGRSLLTGLSSYRRAEKAGGFVVGDLLAGRRAMQAHHPNAGFGGETP